MSLNPDALRATLRYWGSGVSVVTSTLQTPDDSRCAGMTVSAFNSLSLEPPLVLVCLSKDATTAQLVRDSGVFGVSILGGDQAEVSDRFAGRIPLVTHGERFEGVDTFELETGVPLISGAIGWLDCRVHAIHDGSTHWIVIGQVVATDSAADRVDPLLYFNRDYHTLSAHTAQS